MTSMIWTQNDIPNWDNLPVNFSEEVVDSLESPTVTVAHCPVLKLASHGRTREDAIDKLKDMVEAFLSELMDKNKLSEVLESYGWKREREGMFSHEDLVPAMLLISS